MVGFFKKLKCFPKQLCSVGISVLLFTASTSYAAENSQPFADALAMPTTGTAPLEVTLDGSASFDSDGEILKYEWTSSDGQTTVGKTTTLTFETEGEYTVNLVVTDDLGAVNTNTAEQMITVFPASNANPPIASFTATPTLGEAPLTVEVDASESSDDGEIVKYEWTSSDGQTAEGVTASFTFESGGEYEISLVIQDDEGLTSDVAKQTVTAGVPAIPTGDVDIGFMNLKDVYTTGESLAITVREVSNTVIRDKNVDLYVSVEIAGQLLFITSDSLTTALVPFRTNIPPSETEHTAFTFDALPSGLEGEYVVRAVYVESGGNLLTQTVSNVEQMVKIVGANAEITFDGMKSVYAVGETVTISVAETSAVQRAERVDLWVAVQLPNDDFLFMSSLLPSLFSSTPLPFATGISPSKTVHSVFEFVVPASLKGKYTLLAVYMKPGENPLFRQDMMRSNVAIFPVELR